MKRGFLIKQKGTKLNKGKNAQDEPTKHSASKESLPCSSSWKRGFLNLDKKKSQTNCDGKKNKDKSFSQGAAKNDCSVERVRRKMNDKNCIQSDKVREGVSFKRKQDKNGHSKNKIQTSSALLFLEEAEPTNQLGMLSIVNLKDNYDKVDKNVDVGSNLVDNTKQIVIPLARNGCEEKEEILLQEIETKVRGGNAVDHGIERAFTPLNVNTGYTRKLPVFELHEKERISSETAQSSNKQKQLLSELDDQTIEVSKTIDENKFTDIDKPCPMVCPGLKKQDGNTTIKSEVTPSIKMELSLLLSTLKSQSKKFRVSYEKAECNRKDDIKLASNKALHKFIQNYLQSERFPHSILTNLNLVWKTILESIALYAKDNFTLPNSTLEQADEAVFLLPPVIWLGQSILQNCSKDGWVALFNVVSDKGEYERIQSYDESVSRDKRRKLQTLGAAVVIKLQLRLSINRLSATTTGDGKGAEDKTCIGVETLLVALPCMIQNFLPFLIGVIERIERKRTLLSTACSDAVFLMIEFTAHIYRSTLYGLNSPSTDAVPSMLWKAFPLIKQILAVTQQGVTSKESTTYRSSKKSADMHGEDITEYIDASRKQCVVAILHDWNRVMSNTEDIYHKCKFVDMQTEQASQKAAMISLCNELAGVKISRDQHEKCLHVPLIIGGIAHTLCKCVPEFNTSSVENILEALEAASYFVESSTENDSVKNLLYHEETIILRAVCSWLARKKNVQFGNCTYPAKGNKDANHNKHQKAVQFSMNSLRSRSGRCLDLVIVILSRLWSNSNGLPADMYEITQSQIQKTGLPMSFDNLLQNFDACECDEEDSTELKPSQKVLCSLVERFLLHKPQILIPFFLSRRQLNMMSVHVLVSILKKNALSEANYSGMLSCDICIPVVQKVLDMVGSSKYLQKKLLESPDILSSFTPSITMPRLIEVIGKEVSTNHITSVVSTVIGSILKFCPEYHIESAISSLLKEVESLDEKGKSRNSFSFPLVKYASTWRRSILQDQSHGQKRYTKLIITIANNMLLNPSSSHALSLFGALFGDGANFCDKAHFIEESIIMRNTVKAVLELALPKINEDAEDHSDQLFPRLSPLLMLRRIPFIYVRLLEINEETDNALLTQLARTITLKLGIEENKAYNEVKTPEEKRLLAEIAARYLPSSAGELSCFERLCRPVFSRTLNSIHQGTLSRRVLDQSKFSLYVVCHFVQIAADEDCADSLVMATAFALEILSITDVCDIGNSSDQLIQLQTGCIDFFATCLQSHCNRVATIDTKHRYGPPKIQEIEPMSNQAIKESNSSQHNTAEKVIITFLGSLFPLLLEIISTAKIPEGLVNTEWLGLKAFQISSKNDTRFCISARTCLLNSFSLAAQRCFKDDGSLEFLARLAVPSILQFAFEAKNENRLKHELCIAASLQFTFNVLTRTKSFQCLKTHPLPLAECVRQIFMLCTNIVRTHSVNLDAYTSTLLRTTSLKLLLIITSIDQCVDASNDDAYINVQDCLSPGELAQVFSILNGIANIDSDRDVKILAAHILTALESNGPIYAE